MKTKSLLCILLLLLGSLTAVAQSSRTRSFSQRLFDAKVAEISQCLNMSKEKEKKFVPIYREYSEEMIRAWNELVINSTDETEQLKQSVRRQERSQAIRLKYTDRFASVLSAAEIRKLYKVENEIQRRLRARKDRARRPH